MFRCKILGIVHLVSMTFVSGAFLPAVTVCQQFLDKLQRSSQRFIAHFTASPRSGETPLTVQFTDTSTGAPSSWAWTFGDGSTSTDRNPQHTYEDTGTHTVSLTISKHVGPFVVTTVETKIAYITAADVPVADFTADDTAPDTGQTIQFTDTSTNAPTTWLWDFGDGSTSTSQNPTHIYSVAGTYDVVLTATNAAGSDSATKTDYIVATGVVSFVSLDFSVAGNSQFVISPTPMRI